MTKVSDFLLFSLSEFNEDMCRQTRSDEALSALNGKIGRTIKKAKKNSVPKLFLHVLGCFSGKHSKLVL